MKLDTNDLLKSIMKSLDRLEYIKTDEIPNIDLYMDQVTTLMDKKLRAVTRYPKEDKILTKTMINNYAKNDLLPPPIKKKYSKEHVLVLIFIYYFKSILSISDIQTLLQPITDKYFDNGKEFGLKDIYEEVFRMESAEIEMLKKDMMEKYEMAQSTFEGMPEEEAEFLHQFSFICLLSYDVYIKKLLVEKLIDDMKDKMPKTNGKADKKSEEVKEK
ncbi:MAG: DUF1836 domain-containing protein [Lachnospiraceae bacterium]|nr:DUF1836 domain-containing protein [Lachnospiraceae bacterium]